MSGNGAETAITMERLTGRPPAWTIDLGPSSETILSSRVRLARNLSSIPFPAQTTPDQQKQVIGRMRRAVEQVDVLDTASFIDFESLEKTVVEFAPADLGRLGLGVVEVIDVNAG